MSKRLLTLLIILFVSVCSFAGYYVPPAVNDDMSAATYDPQSIEGDAFNLNLHTGTIAHDSATITGTGTNSHATIDTFIASKAQASGLASLDGSSLVVQNPANSTATPTASKILIAEGSGKIADGWLSSNVSLMGQTIAHNSLTGTGTNSHAVIDTFIASKAQASGLASLDGSSLVVQNPANSTATPTASKILIAEGSGKIADGWLSTNVTLLGQTIAHNSLTGTGTNAHTVIDSHIADSTDPHSATLTQTAATIAGVAAPYIAQTSGTGTGITLAGTSTFPSGVWGSAGAVGIGTTTPGTALAVIGDITADNYNATTGYYVGNNSLTTSLLSINTTGSLAAQFLNSTLADAGSVYMYFGKDTTSNGGFLQYYKATDGISTSNYLHMNHVGLSEGGIYVRGSDGNVGINKASPEAKLVVREPNVGQVAMRVQVDNTGIAGTAFIEFTRGGDAVVGGIIASSDTNVNYVNFAGAHYTETEDIEIENVQPYMVLESTGEIYEKYSKCFKTRICKTRKSANAIGVYGGKTTDNMDMITCLGAGRIWVANKGENIEVGDYLMSSDIAGMSEKQDDDILHNYTIAKSSVGVAWEAGEESRLIACTYHGG